MASIVGLFILILSTTVFSYEHEEHEHHEHEEHVEHHHEPDYKFEYKVDDHKTGDFKSHRESRKGDKVDGYYMLKESDGTIREVHYTSDKHSGFNAVVSKSGEPHEHHEHQEHKDHAIHYGHVHEEYKPHEEHEEYKHVEYKHEEPKHEEKHVVHWGHVEEEHKPEHSLKHHYKQVLHHKESPKEHHQEHEKHEFQEGRIYPKYAHYNTPKNSKTQNFKRDLPYQRQHSRVTPKIRNYEVVESRRSYY